MKTKGFKLKTSTGYYMVCRWCGLHFSYDAQSIRSMKRTKKAAEYHNQHSCRKNPANGYCETCAHALIMGLDLHCAYTDELNTRSSAPHPCSGYKQKGDER